jgi:hypothetical protein
MFPDDRIIFLDLPLIGRDSLVLGTGIIVAGSGTGYQLYRFTHTDSPYLLSLDPLTAGTHIGKHRIDAFLVYYPDPLAGNTHANPSILTLDPELAMMQVRYKSTACLVMRMRDIIAPDGALSCYLANSGHCLRT